MRGPLPCKWLVNDLQSINPELKATDRVVRTMQSSNYSASCTPVTAIDFCNKILEPQIFNVNRYGRTEGSALGKREAWEEVEVALYEHAVCAQSDGYNKWRRTRDTLFEVPIIGHVISTDDHDVQQSMTWPVLNGKACVPVALWI